VNNAETSETKEIVAGRNFAKLRSLGQIVCPSDVQE
jgi:hypothetical protein